MSNTYKCTICLRIHGDACPECGAGQRRVLGDLWLTALGLDAYAGVEARPDGAYLIIKKPSGQVRIPLQPEDMGPPPPEPWPRKGA